MQSDADHLAPRDCLIPRVPELDVAVDALASAADALLAGGFDAVRAHLTAANIPLLRDLSLRAMGPLNNEIHRLRAVPLPAKVNKSTLRMPGKAATDQVFARDGWRCRFCGVRVVVPAARKALAAAVPDALCWSGPNEGQHAAFLYVSATLDHVVPHSRGGTNDAENLVAACWPCNFGRGGYTLEQMGLRDPRLRTPVSDEWDGLLRLVRQPTKTPQAPPSTKDRRPLKPAVADPVPAVPRPTRKRILSAPEWLAEVDGIGDDTAERMLAFLASCGDLPVSSSAVDVLMLRMSVGGRTLSVFGFERSGGVQIPWSIGDAKPAFREFAALLASIIPGAYAHETPKTWTVKHEENRPLQIEELLDAAKEVRNALAVLEADLAALPPPES